MDGDPVGCRADNGMMMPANERDAVPAGHGGQPDTFPSPLYPLRPAGRRALRVLLIAPDQVPAWLQSFVDLAGASGWVDLTLLPTANACASRIPSVAADVRGYLTIERLRHRRRHARTMLSPVPLLAHGRVTLRPRLDEQVPADDLLRVVKAEAPDLILLLGPERWSRDLAECAGAGCWRIDEGLIDAEFGGLPLLAPVVAGDCATLLDLQVDYGDGQTLTIGRSWGATLPESFELQRDRAFRKVPALLMRSLRQLADERLKGLQPRLPGTLRLSPLKTGFAAGMRAFSIAVAHSLRRRMRKGKPSEPWQLAVRRAPVALDPASPAVEGTVSMLAAREGHCWADPCVVEVDGRHLVFAEEFPIGMGKGVIVCVELERDGRSRRLGLALEEPSHLSYPQVFSWQDAWYMTVESGAARRVSVYKSEEFPLRWVRMHDLVSNRVCVDPTLHEHDGHWYLFANVSESEGSTCDELFLFVADSPLGPFSPHPANPIVSDVRMARPAGRLFHHDGKLVRPAQNCGPSYGAEIAFQEVVELTPDHYRERPLGRLAPWESHFDGCHTYSRIAGIELLDARDRRLQLSEKCV